LILIENGLEESDENFEAFAQIATMEAGIYQGMR
jgi:hypothetical protein